MRLAPFTMAATVEAEQAVKSGAGHNPAGCSRTGQPGNGALADHVGSGERLASTGGWRPRTPDNRTRLRAKAAAALNAHAEQHQQPGWSHKSSKPAAEGWPSELPLELCDIQGESCVCGAVVWTADGGKIMARYHPGKKKGCQRCGRQLRARYWPD